MAAASLAVANSLFCAWGQAWTYDERFHLEWNERFWDTGVSERLSQPRFNTKTPVLLPNVLLRKAARGVGLEDRRTLRLVARLPGTLWLLLLLSLVYLLARSSLDPSAALISCAAVALDPNLVAHSSVATTDLPYAVATVASLAAGLRFWRSPSTARGLVLGLAIGLGFVAKSTAFLLLPGLFVLPWAVRVRPARRLVWPGVLAAAGAAWALVGAAYLFREMFRPVAELGLQSGALAWLARAAPRLRLPLPAPFLTALDASAAAERGQWNVMVLGRRLDERVWYYFPVHWLLKTPLALLVAQAAGLGLTLCCRAASTTALRRLLWWNVGLMLAYFCLVFRTQIGYRFVLMAIPLVSVLAVTGLQERLSACGQRVLVGVVFFAAAAEGAAYAGNALAFTNILIWPKRNAYRFVADSNIDWGQNRERIQERLAQPGWTTARLDPIHILPGRNVLGLNMLAGLWYPERHRWVREHLEPAGHFRHTYLWYDVDGETFNQFLDADRHLASHALEAGLCPPQLKYERWKAPNDIPLSTGRDGVRGPRWVACVSVRREADVALRVLDGRVEFGHYAADGSCVAEVLDAGQEAWYRLEPGLHALCLWAPPNRRTRLPSRMHTSWLVRGHGVLTSLRRLEPTPAPPEGPSRPGSSLPRQP